MNIPKIVFHYTSFENFKKIIEFGTLRFTLSTSSNDSLDTIYIHSIVEQLLKNFNLESSEEKEIMRYHIFSMFQSAKITDYTFALCFSTIKDSRLLWDAYTINKSRLKCTYGENKYCINSDSMNYDGVCLAINTNKLESILKAEKDNKIFTEYTCRPVLYLKSDQESAIKFLLDNAWEYYLSKKGKNKNDCPFPSVLYNPEYVTEEKLKIAYSSIRLCSRISFLEAAIKFSADLQYISPFIKHIFWQEEQEIRAVLYRNKNDVYLKDFIVNTGNCLYIDIPIDEGIFEEIIIGPTFSDKNFKEIENINNAKLKFEKMMFTPSIGKGVIRNR